MGLSSAVVGRRSTFRTTSVPLMTLPKTTCFLQTEAAMRDTRELRAVQCRGWGEHLPVEVGRGGRGAARERKEEEGG